LKAVLEDAASSVLNSDLDDIQTGFSNIDCDDPAYCIKL